MKRVVSVLLILITLFSSMILFTGCDDKEEYITNLEQLNDDKYTFTVNPGSAPEKDCSREFPNAKKVYAND